MKKKNTINKNLKIANFIDYLKNNLNEDRGFNLNSDPIFSFEATYDKNLSEEEKEYISSIFRTIEQNNLFFVDNDFEFEAYKKFFENIVLKEIDYSTFFSDLKKYSLFSLEDACFNLILKYDGSLIEIFISLLAKENKHFENDEETTIKILNLDINDEIKKKYIELNKTKIKKTYEIISDEIRVFYFRKQIEEKIKMFKQKES